MSLLKNMSMILVIFGLVATILERTEAADHTVGGSTTGWTSSAGAKFYSDWASNNTFKQNDVLVFNFLAGAHTVAETNKADFDNCNVNQNAIVTTSPARLPLNRTGDFYFICTISTHCQSGGQKLTINVPASSSSTPPSPTPPPSSGTTPTSPTSGGTPSPSSPAQPGATPPSPGSAAALVATFPAFVALVVNLLV